MPPSSMLSPTGELLPYRVADELLTVDPLFVDLKQSNKLSVET